jgi:hypothetical protein
MRCIYLKKLVFERSWCERRKFQYTWVELRHEPSVSRLPNIQREPLLRGTVVEINLTNLFNVEGKLVYLIAAPNRCK